MSRLGVKFANMLFNRLLGCMQRGSRRQANLLMCLDAEPLVLQAVAVPRDGSPAQGPSFRDFLPNGAFVLDDEAPLRQVLGRVFTDMHNDQPFGRWPRTTLWFAAVAACRYAQRLFEEGGGAPPGFALERIPPDFDDLFDACLRDSTDGLGTLALEFADRCIAGLCDRACAVARGTEPGLVLFSPEDGCGIVEWRARDGKGTVLMRESLFEFAEALVRDAEPPARERLDRAGARAQRRHTLAARRVLEAVHAGAAALVETACQHNQRAVLFLGMTRGRRGAPMSVHLFATPREFWDRVGDVTIDVRTRHDHFVLEASDRKRFYFGPCLLSARLTAGRSGLTVRRNPTVVIPKDFPWFFHPYTGQVQESTFTTALRIDGEADPLCRLPPEVLQAQGIIPQLSLRVPVELERDICIAQQQESIQTLVATCGLAEDRGDPGLLRLVSGLHDLAHLGLCHAHCRNGATPRAHIHEMPFPLPPGPLQDWLKGRAFSYELHGVV